MIYEKVVKILCEQLGLEEEKVNKDSDLFEDLGADSLDVVTLLMALEEEFDLSIEDEQAQEFHTVNDIVSFIENNG